MIFVSILICIFLSVYLFTKQKKFGSKATGKRLAAMQQSPHYKNGSFHNLSHTPALTEGTGYCDILKDFLFNRNNNVKPTVEIPHQFTNLQQLHPDENILVWFGHSSYFIQVDGIKILVDPVFSGSASPLPGGTKAFKGANQYQSEHMPNIDLLLITHDHWDHLDYKSMLELKPKVKKVITGLGTGAHLEYWGYDANIITELDWFQQHQHNTDTIIHATPARHFSGRTFTRNQNIWLSFVLHTQKHKLFLGGDSGYDTHFNMIGKTHGPFDMAIIENGQFDAKWRYIHLLPDEFIKVGKEINANCILPVHSSKFALSNHDWQHPLESITQLNKEAQLPIITPCIGEKVALKNKQTYSHWWKNL